MTVSAIGKRVKRGDTISVSKTDFVEFVNEDTGESRPCLLPVGEYAGSAILAMRQDGEAAFFSGRITRPVRALVIDPAGRFESAANPHFRVDNAARVASLLDRRLRRLSVMERRLAEGLRAQERAKADPPKAEPEPPPPPPAKLPSPSGDAVSG